MYDGSKAEEPIIFLLYKLIVNSLTWEWSAAHYNRPLKKIMYLKNFNNKKLYACK